MTVYDEIHHRCSDRVRTVVELARGAAVAAQRDAVTDEDLLVGLLREGSGGANAILGDPAGRRDLLASIAGPEPVEPAEPDEAPPFAASAERALAAAAGESTAMRYGFIGTEHVLLGLLAAGGEAARLLAGLGTDLGRARAAVVEWTGPTAGFAVERIVSGGPTGVDRAALDVALEYGIPHGGWCPRGRLAEDGRVPANYTMRETDSANFAVRTERNVVDSDATLVFTVGEPSGGTRLTIELCGKHDKPHFVADLRRPPHLVIGDVNRWLVAQSPPTLNVAGPRESGAPGVHAHARMVLGQAMFLARR